MVTKSKAVSCPQRKMRIMSVIVDGTGTAALTGICSKNMALVDNGTGDYNLNFNIAYRQVPQVIATPVTDNIICKIGTVTAAGAQVLTENLSGAATDADFHVMILGSDTTDQL